MKKIPMRRCLATNVSFPKKELLRIVKTPEGKIVVDVTGKVNGKGAYISKSAEALQIAKQKKIFNRAFECEVEDALYDEIEKVING